MDAAVVSTLTSIARLFRISQFEILGLPEDWFCLMLGFSDIFLNLMPDNELTGVFRCYSATHVILAYHVISPNIISWKFIVV